MRKRVTALVLALALAAVATAAYAWENRLTDDDVPCVSYPTAQQAASWQFMRGQYERRSERGDGPVPVFGSSELNPAPAGFSHPGNLLAPGAYDVSAMMAGRAGCADLWQAIEIGAFASIPDAPKRVVIFPSIQWFMTYRRPERDFPEVYSRGALDAFMENASISGELKHRVAERVHEYGVGEDDGGTPVDRLVDDLDDAAKSIASDLRLAHDVATADRVDREDVADGEAPRSADEGPTGGADAAGGPDWSAVFDRADREARAKASRNDLGMNDAWYDKHFETWLAGARKSWKVDDGEFFSTQEFEDFKMVLDVCRETGVEPLIVIQPVKGEAYDRTIYTCDVRQGYYRMIREAALEAGVQVADFSAHEYDRYFLRDYSHPSELGSAYYSKAIYTFQKTGEADIRPSGDIAPTGA